LVLSNTLWIDEKGENVLKLRIILDHTHGLLQDFDDRRFAGIGISNNHETMSYCARLIELNTLVQENLFRLYVVIDARLFHVYKQFSVVLLWKSNAWEQITGDTVKEGDIVRCELGAIDIVKRLQANLILWPIRQEPPLVTASSKDGLYSSHTEIVVILRRQKLG